MSGPVPHELSIHAEKSAIDMPHDKRHLREIYVALLDKGSDVWRRVDAVYEGEDSYRIISENNDAAERWEYTTGEIVRCRSTTMPDGEHVLVATERLHRRDDRGGS